VDPITLQALIENSRKLLDSAITHLAKGIILRAKTRLLIERLRDQVEYLSNVYRLASEHAGSLRYVRTCLRMQTKLDKSKEHIDASVQTAYLSLIDLSALTEHGTAVPENIVAELKKRHQWRPTQLRRELVDQIGKSLGSLDDADREFADLKGIETAQDFTSFHAKCKQQDIIMHMQNYRSESKALRVRLQDARTDLTTRSDQSLSQALILSSGFSNSFGPVLDALFDLRSVLLESIENEFTAMVPTHQKEKIDR